MSRRIDELDESSQARLPCEDVLRILAEYRRDDEIVVTNQMSARVWPAFSEHELDFNYLSSTMGGAIPLALGLALAKPELQVIVLSGDGSLLMNLGCLATVVASNIENLTVVLLDNGLYEVTGGQQTAGSLAKVDFAAIARGCGIENSIAVQNAEHWRELISKRRTKCAIQFYAIKVDRISPATPRNSTTKVDEKIKALRERLTQKSVAHRQQSC